MAVGQVQNVLRELIIDLDFKYHLVSANEFTTQLAHFCRNPLVKVLPVDCASLQMQALETFMATKGMHYLSAEETNKFIIQIDYFISRLMNTDIGSEDFLELAQSERQRYIEWLLELKEKCRVMVELDKYIVGIEVYMENKPKITGQTVDVSQALRQELINLRTKLNTFSSQEARHELEELLEHYYGTKQHQGSFRFWRNQEPGSILALKKVKEQIDNNAIYQEVARIANTEMDRIVKQDLDKFIRELDGYLGSFRVYHLRGPDLSTQTLRDKLNDIRTQLDEQNIEESAFQMNQLIQAYIEDRPAKLAVAGLVLDAGTVSVLKKAASERQAEEFAIAKERTESERKVIKIKLN